MRTTASCLLLVALAACSPQPAPPRAAGRAAMGDSSGSIDIGGRTVQLPKTIIAEWTRPEAGRRITAETIFDYMDGAGELYLAYRFEHLEVYEYKSPDGSLGTILVELYLMKSPLDAFGLLSTDWTGEPVVLGSAAGGDDHPRVDSVPPHHALFGAGLLRLWSGNLYARVLASRDTPVTRDAVMAIGRALHAGEMPSPPGFIASVPLSTAGWPRSDGSKPPAGRRIRPNRTCFFRSHLVLNSQYFLASEDILRLGRDAAGVTTEYAPSPPGSRPLRLIVVRYPAAGVAAAAAESFLTGYLPHAARTGGSDRGAARTEHGWVAWRVHGPGLAIALDAEDAATARRLSEQAAQVPATDITLQ